MLRRKYWATEDDHHDIFPSPVACPACARSHVACDGQSCQSIRLNHLPPLTPFSSAANMRSLHTVASTHDQSRPWISAPCLALLGTAGASLLLCPVISLTPLPACLPSLGAALLPALLAGWFSRGGTMKALIAAQLTYRAALPAYLATPSCRSVSNHVGCLSIASHHASVTSVFRTSP